MATKAEKDQADYIAHGSPEHSVLLGLKKADKDDGIQVDGWTLVDLTMFGPQVTETYLREVIRQKVSELKTGAPPVPQSDDPRKPGYAPLMWEPKRIAP